MKNLYTTPIVEVLDFIEKNDIICASGEASMPGELFGGTSAASAGSASMSSLLD